MHDTNGDIVTPLGSIERCRELLECNKKYKSKVLRAGELVWLTDRTPHECLPVEQDTGRQFFRLVVGKIAFWFSDHSTPNPIGYEIPSDVPIVHGNKFDNIKREGTLKILWEVGSEEELELAKQRYNLREFLCRHALGFIYNDLIASNICSIQDLQEEISDRSKLLECLKDKYQNYTFCYIRNICATAVREIGR